MQYTVRQIRNKEAQLYVSDKSTDLFKQYVCYIINGHAGSPHIDVPNGYYLVDAYSLAGYIYSETNSFSGLDEHVIESPATILITQDDIRTGQFNVEPGTDYNINDTPILAEWPLDVSPFQMYEWTPTYDNVKSVLNYVEKTTEHPGVHMIREYIDNLVKSKNGTNPLDKKSQSYTMKRSKSPVSVELNGDTVRLAYNTIIHYHSTDDIPRDDIPDFDTLKYGSYVNFDANWYTITDTPATNVIIRTIKDYTESLMDKVD